MDVTRPKYRMGRRIHFSARACSMQIPPLRRGTEARRGRFVGCSAKSLAGFAAGRKGTLTCFPHGAIQSADFSTLFERFPASCKKGVVHAQPERRGGQPVRKSVLGWRNGPTRKPCRRFPTSPAAQSKVSEIEALRCRQNEENEKSSPSSPSSARKAIKWPRLEARKRN